MRAAKASTRTSLSRAAPCPGSWTHAHLGPRETGAVLRGRLCRGRDGCDLGGAAGGMWT